MKYNDSFSKFLLYSFGAHVVLAIFLIVKVFFFSSDTVDFQSSIRVDIVALPDKIKSQAPVAKVETKPEPVEVKKKPKPKKPKPKPKPKKLKIVKKKAPKEEQNSAIARLKAMKKIRDQQKKSETQKIEYKGNQRNLGNSLVGMEKLQHDAYLSKVLPHLKSHWNLPEWLANDTLGASVLLLINRNGTIKMKRFLSASGNKNFDEHVMGTISKAEPLPAPPSRLSGFYSAKGIEVRFP